MKDQSYRSPENFSTPMINGRLRALVTEMGVRPMPKSLRLAELVEWVIRELPKLAPDDPRTAQAVELAQVLWQRSRD